MADRGSDGRGSAARSLGRFFGYIRAGLRADVGGGERVEMRREVEEREGEASGRRVTLRRTTIEEVEVHPRDERESAGGGGADRSER